MTKDKDGEAIFKVGKTYRMKALVNPVWPRGSEAKCLDVREDGHFGMFQVGDDCRWWAANDGQFDEV